MSCPVVLVNASLLHDQAYDSLTLLCRSEAAAGNEDVEAFKFASGYAFLAFAEPLDVISPRDEESKKQAIAALFRVGGERWAKLLEAVYDLLAGDNPPMHCHDERYLWLEGWKVVCEEPTTMDLCFIARSGILQPSEPELSQAIVAFVEDNRASLDMLLAPPLEFAHDEPPVAGWAKQ